MRILILAPHQDDEIIAAGLLIQVSVGRGDDVYVAFATNGDYHGREIAAQRYQESIDALQMLHIGKDHVLYMGYGDTGMRYSHSFLYRLYQQAGQDVLPTPLSKQTYHPVGGETLHYACTAREAAYCHDCFLEDLNNLLEVCRPDIVILPSRQDRHGDHSACFLFMEKVCRMRGQAPVLLTYLLHAGNDLMWPNRRGERFQRPQLISSRQWNQRVTVYGSDAMKHVKQSCIRCFQSQAVEGDESYLLSFAKCEENFFSACGGSSNHEYLSVRKIWASL